jgi:hypothetical protein
VQPVLQRADGSYIGTVSTSTANPMIAFTSSGNTLWMAPNDSPQIATAGGGVIGASGTTYDQNGNVTGQIVNMRTRSWAGQKPWRILPTYNPPRRVLAGSLSGGLPCVADSTYRFSFSAC